MEENDSIFCMESMIPNITYYLFPLIPSTVVGENHKVFDPVCTMNYFALNFSQFDFELFTGNGTIIAPPFHLRVSKKTKKKQVVVVTWCAENWVFLNVRHKFIVCLQRCDVHSIAVHHGLGALLGGDCPVSLAHSGNYLRVFFCLEGSNGAGVALLLTEHCDSQFDSSHQSDDLLSPSVVFPSSALLTLL